MHYTPQTEVTNVAHASTRMTSTIKSTLQLRQPTVSPTEQQIVCQGLARTCVVPQPRLNPKQTGINPKQKGTMFNKTTEAMTSTILAWSLDADSLISVMYSYPFGP